MDWTEARQNAKLVGHFGTPGINFSSGAKFRVTLCYATGSVKLRACQSLPRFPAPTNYRHVKERGSVDWNDHM